MIGLIMCGGRGRRMQLSKNEEKLMLKRDGIPLIQQIVSSLEQSENINKIVAAVNSQNAPKASQFLSQFDIEQVETPGDGFGKDMSFALRKLTGRVLVLPADLPFLDVKTIDEVIGRTNSLLDRLQQRDKDNKVCVSVMLSEGFLTAENLLDGKEFWTSEKNGTKLYYSGISLVDACDFDECEFFTEKFVTVDNRSLAVNINTIKDYYSSIDS